MNGQDTVGDSASPTGVPIARPIIVLPHAEPVSTHPMLLADASRREALNDIATLLCVFFLTWVLAQSIWSIMEWFGLVGDPRLLGVVLTVPGAAVCVGATVQLARPRGSWKASLGLCYTCWWLTGLCGALALVVAYAAMLATVAVAAMSYPAGIEALKHNQELLVENFPKLHPLLLCALALTVGFYEELIFRGFLLTRLRRATGSASVAVLISALFFAAPHAASQELIAVIPLFVMGVGWSVITLWQKSVIPAIIAHAAFDLFNLLALYFFSPAWK